MTTFEEIAKAANDMKWIPVGGGVGGYKRDIQLIESLAVAMHKLEFNTAYQLALLTMTDCPKMSEGHELMVAWERQLHEKTKAAILALRSEPIQLA